MLFTSILLAIGLAAGTTVATSSAKDKRTDKFQFVGVNLSGPELQASTTALPGVYSTDYTWFNLSTIDVFVSQRAMNSFRINILMERLVPGSLTNSAMDPDYLGNLTETVEYITGKGAYAIITPMNGGRYYGSVINSTSDFEGFWRTVAGVFKDNQLVMFNANSGYHNISTQQVVDLNQAAINGIRAAGATSQYITVEGNDHSLAGLWTNGTGSDGLTNAHAMGNLTDSSDSLVYQMSSYLDPLGTGFNGTCASTTLGPERLANATAWLQAHNKFGIIGAYAGGVSWQCTAAVITMLNYLAENDEFWLGALWWTAGPWEGEDMFSLEPTTGAAYSTYAPIIKNHD
ncbi:hypothetical protein LTR36_010170 [Oleoguttula mirabilis]|uniref:cellulase n=1 Tax=Oleoguttula mirabilis TaxID=1507867 RepID=A0AAV9JS29_9PEZI|nr:hypothetical protein LTR36_010170 [Oleoguttula mirabilis]